MGKFLIGSFAVLFLTSTAAHAATASKCLFEGQQIAGYAKIDDRATVVRVVCVQRSGGFRQQLTSEWAGEEGNGILLLLAEADSFDDLSLRPLGNAGDLQPMLHATAVTGGEKRVLDFTACDLKGGGLNCEPVPVGD